MACRGLYYPYIHFKNPTWLKAAVMYWDQIGRIVPGGGYELHDNDDVQLLKNHVRSDGSPDPIVEDFYPSGAEVSVGKEFLELITQRSAELERYRLSHRHEWKIDPYTASAAPPAADKRLAYVMEHKLSSDLVEALVKSDLGTLDEQSRKGWLGMNPRLTSVYMTSLAEAMAKQEAAHPLADDSTDFVSTAGREVERLAQALMPGTELGGPKRTDYEIEAAMVSVAIENVVPADLSAISMSELIDIRGRYTAERTAFNDAIVSLTEGIGGLEEATPEALRYHLQKEYDNRVKPALDATEQKLRDNKVKAVRDVVATKLTLPASLASVAGLLGLGVMPPIVLGAGAVFAILGALQTKRTSDRQVSADSWASFLLPFQRDLTALQVTDDVLQSARKFEPSPG